MTWPEALVWVAAIAAVAYVLVYGAFTFSVKFKDDDDEKRPSCPKKGA